MSQPDPDFEALLHHLKQTRGFDFTGYKRSSLVRRVARRMSQVGLTEYGDYLDHHELHAEEFTALFNTILINVTGFFRDPDAWDYLRSEVLPALLASKSATEPVRVWSAGCASGEEAYTLAIVLAEMLGPSEFRDRVIEGDEEQIDRFLRQLVQRELLAGEAVAMGFETPVERVDSAIAAARAQLSGAAELLGLASIDRAPGEDLEPAVARAVLEAVGKVLTGATEMVQLGGIEYQLQEGSPSAVYDRGVGEAILRIGQLRANRSASILEEASGTADPAGDTISDGR